MQAARGTPIAGRRSRPRLLLAAVAGVAFAVDQVTKVVAVARLEGRAEDVEVLGELLQLHLTRNPGAAFSTATEFTPALSVFACVVAVGVVWFARRVRTTGWAVALGLLLAGVTGNLADRLLREPGPFRGEVIDFLMLPNWPVFNVADICINVAAGLILVQAFRGVGLDGTRESKTHEADDEGEDQPDEETPGEGLADGDPPGEAGRPSAGRRQAPHQARGAGE